MFQPPTYLCKKMSCQEQLRDSHWSHSGAVSSDQEVPWPSDEQYVSCEHFLEPSVCLGCLFSPDAVRRHGCVQAGWCRWQQAGLGLHSQMGDDRELLPAPTHLLHHLCWEGDQLYTKPQDLAARLDSFSGSQTALSKHPGMWECSAPNQTSAPCWESSRWSWGL